MKNSKWHTYRQDASVTYIFVHGFLSDPQSCWKATAYWPDLLKKDRRLGRPDIYIAKYTSQVESGEYDITQCVNELYTALITPDAAGYVAPITRKNLIFVCHSMGGIVVREMLESYHTRFSDKKIGLLLFSSPSQGSLWANKFGFVGKIFGNKQLKGLRIGDPALKSLDERFRRLLAEKRIPYLIGAEASEHQPMLRFKYLPNFMQKIVASDSSSRYFGNTRIIPNTNHSTIVKPNTLEHPSHEFLVSFYLNQYQKAEPLSVLDTNVAKASNDPNVSNNESLYSKISDILFDVLGLNTRLYYLKREKDAEITKTLSLYSVWLTGPSGCGKTSAARYYIYENGFSPIDVCLSAYSQKLTRNDCIEEIASSIEQRSGRPLGSVQRTFNSIAAELSKIAQTSKLVLYFDEVPLRPEDRETSKEFTQFLVALLNLIKDQSKEPSLRILLSSIETPVDSDFFSEKINERLKIIHLREWDLTEMKELFNLLERNLKPLVGSIGERTKVIDSSFGLPRKMKSILREQIIQDVNKADAQMTPIGRFPNGGFHG